MGAKMKVRRLFADVPDVKCLIKDLKMGDEISKTLRSGVIVVNGVEFPFTEKNFSISGIGNMRAGITHSLKIKVADKQPSEKHARRDYVIIFLEFLSCQIAIYLKKEHLNNFITAVATGDDLASPRDTNFIKDSQRLL